MCFGSIFFKFTDTAFVRNECIIYIDKILIIRCKSVFDIVDIPAGTANINDLTQFRPTDISNALGEGVLPAVTSADAGDVLTVDNNGDWVAATPGNTSGDFSMGLSGTGTTVYWERSGNIVQLAAEFTLDTPHVAGTIFTIPSALLPKVGVRFYIFDSIGNQYLFALDTSGNVISDSNIPNRAIYFSCTYLAD